MAKRSSFSRALTEEDLPFIRAIFASPRDFSVRLAYADWLEGRGENTRAEFLRMWVALNDPASMGQSTADFRQRFQELRSSLNGHWVGFIGTWQTRAEEVAGVQPAGLIGQTTDAVLGYGPCAICGRAKNLPGHVTRMPCERCGRVFCWECADTGVYGSLPDFRHFVTGGFARSGYRFGSDSCLFCQKTTWMIAHGG